MNVIAKYENLVFSAIKFKSTGEQWHLQFLDFFELDSKLFVKNFSEFFPTDEYEYQILGSKTKPLDNNIKNEIEIMLKEPLMQESIRQHNLNKLL